MNNNIKVRYHGWRTSKLTKVVRLQDFTPTGSNITFYGVQVEFENGDSVRHYHPDFHNIYNLREGYNYFYRLKDEISNPGLPTEKTKTKFDFFQQDIPVEYIAQQQIFQEFTKMITLSASYSKDLMVGKAWNENTFKKQAACMFNWMKMKYHEEFSIQSENAVISESPEIKEEDPVTKEGN
jgi:hypothetical protein